MKVDNNMGCLSGLKWFIINDEGDDVKGDDDDGDYNIGDVTKRW